MIGRRVYPDADGWLTGAMRPGEYGRSTHALVVGRASGWWQVCAPDGSEGSLNPAVHAVVENEDGTISVTPSIDFSKRKAGAYHAGF